MITSSKENKKFRLKRTLSNKKGKNENPRFIGWYLSTTSTQSSNALVEPFFPMFARSLGASAGELGFITGIFSLINISQLFWAKLIDKMGKSRIFAVLGQFLSAILFLPYLLLQVGNIFFLTIIRFLQGFFLSASIPSQANLMADHIPEKDRGKIVTRFTKLGMVGAFIGTLTGGTIFTFLLAEHFLTQEDAFKFIFIITALLGIFSSLILHISVFDRKHINKLDDISLINRENFLLPSKLPLRKKFLAYIRNFKDFWIFVLFAVIFNFAAHSASPFFIVLEIELYGFSFLEASILTACSLISQIFMAFMLEKYDILNNYGRKKFLFLGNLVIIIVTFLIIIPVYFTDLPVFFWCFISWILLGIGWGTFNSAIAVLLLDIAHPKYRTILIAFFNTFIGFGMFLGPIVGGIIIDLSVNISYAFIFRTIILILALITIPLIKEPVISGIILKPIRNIFPQLFRVSASRGPNIMITTGTPQKIRKKHWYSNGFTRVGKKFSH